MRLYQGKGSLPQNGQLPILVLFELSAGVPLRQRLFRNWWGLTCAWSDGAVAEGAVEQHANSDQNALKVDCAPAVHGVRIPVRLDRRPS
ncbi:hypothetical protein M2157_008677 [Streptomyces sp. SAI-127]|nr:hypothetical protein [Streptomyces sp. SAI-127]